MIQKQCYTATLAERMEVSSRLAVFRFQVEVPLTFTPGQYATLGLVVDGELIERPYSIVSSPYEEFLEFFVELVPGGDFTSKLWGLRLGSAILVRRGIVGRFNLESQFSSHLMLATVTGVAPFVSMLRTRQFEPLDEPRSTDRFLVIHGASRSVDFGPYFEELTDLSGSGWLNYVPTVSGPWEEPNWTGETGRIEDVVRKHADRLGFVSTNTVAYTCGHPAMVDNAKGILARAGFSKQQIMNSISEFTSLRIHKPCLSKRNQDRLPPPETCSDFEERCVSELADGAQTENCAGRGSLGGWIHAVNDSKTDVLSTVHRCGGN